MNHLTKKIIGHSFWKAFLGMCLLLLGAFNPLAGQNSAPVLSPIVDVTLEEEGGAGLVIASASATDANDDVITYSLGVNPTSASSFFSIDGATGVITTAANLDYEEIWQITTSDPLFISLTVTASDGFATDNESFLVYVTNIDDIPYTQGEASGNISLNGSTSIGQSFTTTDAGNIIQFEINVVSPPSSGMATVQFWQDSDFNPTASFTGPGHTETTLLYEFQTEITSAGVQTITLPSSLAVAANTVYSMEMFGAGMFLRYAFPATYSRGRILWSNNLFGCCDLHFVLTIGEGGGNLALDEPLNNSNIDASTGVLMFTWDVDGDEESGETGDDVDSDDTFSLVLQAPGEAALMYEGIEDEGFEVSLADLVGGVIYEWYVVNEETEAESQVFRFTTPSDLEVIVDQITGIYNPAFSTPMVSMPNPFTDQVTIQYDLKELYDVGLEVYDLRGVRIAALSPQPSSLKGSFVWDGRSERGEEAESGLYMYRLVLSRDGLVDQVINGRLVKQ